MKSNGRLEATQVDVSAKYPGRLATLTVNEGDEVTAGQVVATISSPETEAQLRSAQAQVLKAKRALAEANALIAQRKSDLDFAGPDYERAKQLVERGNISQQATDSRRNKLEAAEAAYVAANAQRDQAEAAIKAAEADVERYQSILVDLVLVAPRSGRVQYRLARSGEVVAAGQRVLTILDLNDVYMTIYLPAEQAGKLALGDEARTILDPVPQYVLPATISFVATEAQFTPKSVETAEEREKLMFRVKLQADPEVLNKYHRQVKTGVRGLGLCPHRSQSSLARRTCGEASAMSEHDRSKGRARNTPLRKDVGAQRPDPRHSRPMHGGGDRARRRRQVHLARPHLRGAQDSNRQGHGARRRHGGRAPSPGELRPHCLHAAGVGPKSLSDPQRFRQHRLLRSPVRPGRGRAARAHRRASESHGTRPLSLIGHAASSQAA